MRRRVWCETLSFEQLLAPAVTQPLVARGIELIMAVRPWNLATVDATVRKLQQQGVVVGLWPMLDDNDGRWASVTTAVAYVALVDAVLAAAPTCNELAIDLEPPIRTMNAWRSGRVPRLQWPSRARFHRASGELATAVARWRAQCRVTTAVLPWLVFDRQQWLARLTGTPIVELPVERHSVMMYTSLVEGWSRGFIDRRRAESMLRRCAIAAIEQLGSRAALSVGAIGPGALTDEPCYRGPDELARDIAIVAAAGIDEITAFDLGGMVRRGPVAAWLDALGG